MFTGIVTHIGRIRGLDRTNAGARMEVEADLDYATLDIGASVSHAGCCLTVIEKTAGGYVVQMVNETLARTTLGEWRVGDPVNLERAARIGDELGGHIVAGHVDGVGEVKSVDQDGESWRVTFHAPAPLHRFIAEKGSITIDGVSLTVTSAEGQTFGVALIPHTWTHTTLNRLTPGAHVNLEIDLIARYAARWRETS
jgi:riboflavin synthase